MSVRNEAVTAIDSLHSMETSSAFKRRFMFRMMFVLAGGTFLDGYVLGIVGPVSTKLTAELNITTFWEGLIAAGALFGILFGSPVGGWAADKYGRKPLFMIDMALFVVASALQFFVNSPLQLFLVRVMMGVAIGAEYSVGWPLLSEFAPARLRGRLMAGMQLAWYGGFMMAFILGHTLSVSTDLGWRFILATSTFISGFILLARIGLPESPRWLWNQNRVRESRIIARRYLESAAEINDIESERTNTSGVRIGMLFSSRYWRATLFMSGFWFCAVTPYFAIATFADSVLKKYGLAGGLTGGIGLSAVALFGVFVAVLLIDKAGRRMLTVPPQWIAATVLATIGLWNSAPPFVALFLFLAFSFLNAVYNTLVAVYPAEVFPTEARGIGTGFAAAVSRVGAALGTFLMPWSISHFGASETILVAAALAVVGAGLSQWLAPETKGKSLTETAAGYAH